MDANDLSNMEVTALETSPHTWNADEMDEVEDTRSRKIVKVSYDKMDMFSQLFSSSSSQFARQTAIQYFHRRLINKMSELVYPTTSNLVKVILEYMKQECKSKSQKAMVEAAWMLTNLVCVSQETCHMVVNEGAVKILEEVIRKPETSKELKLQCLWAIGNIAADCPTCGKHCRTVEIFKLLGNILENNEYKDHKELKIVIWVTLNVIKEKAFIKEKDVIQNIFGSCYRVLLRFENNFGITSDAIGCIAAIADMPCGRPILASQPILLDQIMKMFMRKNNYHQLGCLRMINNLVCGTVAAPLPIVRFVNFYTTIKEVLKCPRKIVRREAVRLCANLAASPHRVEYLFHDDEVFTTLLHETCRSDFDPKTYFICKWALINILCTSGGERMRWLIGAGVFNTFHHMVTCPVPALVGRCLSVLIAMLTKHPHYIALIKKSRVIDKINTTALQQLHNGLELKQELQRIIESSPTKKRPFTFKFCRSMDQSEMRT